MEYKEEIRSCKTENLLLGLSSRDKALFYEMNRDESSDCFCPSQNTTTRAIVIGLATI